MQVSQSLSQQDHVSADDVERYEVIDGVRVEREPMGAFETVLASWLCHLLNSFAAGKKLGLAVSEVLFVLNAQRNLRRRPDVHDEHTILPRRREHRRARVIPPHLLVIPNDHHLRSGREGTREHADHEQKQHDRPSTFHHYLLSHSALLRPRRPIKRVQMLGGEEWPD